MDNWLLMVLTLAIAAGPAYAATRAPSLRPHSIWVRIAVFSGVLVWCLPIALFFALVMLGSLFGIDLMD